MASTTITPPASAPAAPASSSPSPAVSTPTPAPTPSPTPSPSPSAFPGEGPSLEDRIGQAWQKVKAEPVEGETTEVPAPAEAAPTTEPAVTEVPAVETPAPEKTEEEKAAEAQPEFVLDDGTSLPPQDFAAALKADPAATKFFDEHPELKNGVFAALRRDSENREIRQYVPDVETAKVVTKAASTFQAIDNHFLEATTPDGANAFVNYWIKEAMIIGDDGQPKVGADGKYELHPALPYIFNHIFTNKLSYLGEQAKKSGDERLQTAVDILREVITPSSPATGEVPDELKPMADSLKAKEEALNRRESESTRQDRERQQTANQQSIERSETNAVTAVRTQLKPLFEKAGLTAFEQTAALREIGDQVDEQFGAQQEDGSWTPGKAPFAPWFQSEWTRISRLPASEDREKALTKLRLTYSNEILGPIAAKVIRDAKSGALNRQTDRQTTVAAQTHASRTEPRGTSITAPSPQGQTPAELRAAFDKQWMETHNGEKPSMEDWFAHARKTVGTGA